MQNFTGPVHLPGTDGYENERLAWNRAVDPKPALVAEALTAEDVRVAVRTAAERELPLAVQSTGHGTVTGNEGALLLRTSRLKGVRIDPARREATVGAGTLWSEVLPEAAWYGLAPMSGTPGIGVTGYTLGGGAGYLSRLHGLAADSLVGARLVTADGELREAEGDLLWALRGGGGNFGVVTELTFRLHPVREVVAGMTFHPFEHAGRLLETYGEWAATAPDALSTAVLLMRGPDGGRLLGLRAFAAEGSERALEPLLAAAGPVLSGAHRAMSFAEASAALGPDHPPMPLRHRFELFRSLPGDLIAALLEAPVDGAEIRHWGGAMTKPGGPAAHRDVPFSITLSQDVELPHATGGTFLNFLTDPGRVADAFTPDAYARLVALKRRWDPATLFRPGLLIGA
ncbi:FAD-binding oxidoreductase [Nonomuraea sp. NPDC050310]